MCAGSPVGDVLRVHQVCQPFNFRCIQAHTLAHSNIYSARSLALQECVWLLPVCACAARQEPPSSTSTCVPCLGVLFGRSCCCYVLQNASRKLEAQECRAPGSVYDCPVLNVCERADHDGVQVGPQHAPVPDAYLLTASSTMVTPRYAGQVRCPGHQAGKQSRQPSLTLQLLQPVPYQKGRSRLCTLR